MRMDAPGPLFATIQLELLGDGLWRRWALCHRARAWIRRAHAPTSSGGTDHMAGTPSSRLDNRLIQLW
jgi:hypothetical protein